MADHSEIQRPSWFPDRLWWHGEPGDPRLFTIREAGPPDVYQVRQLLIEAGRRPPAATLSRWLSQYGYVVRIATRGRYAVAVCVSRHRPTNNVVLVCHVDPAYRGTRHVLEEQLLTLACHELPEAASEITVPDDPGRAERLRGWGWKLTHGGEGEGDRWTFHRGPVWRPGPGVGEPGDAEAPRPARYGPGRRPTGDHGGVVQEDV